MGDLEQIKLVTGISYPIVKFLIVYHKVAIILGTFFLEESFILAASFLSAQGFFSPFSVFIFSICGVVLCDFFWFFFGVRFLKILHQWFIYEKSSNTLDKIIKKRPFLILLIFKFLYGIKFLLIVHFSITGMKWKKFAFYDILGTTLLLSVLLPIGWLAGKGIYNFIPIYKKFNYVIFALFVFLIIFNIAASIIRKKIAKI